MYGYLNYENSIINDVIVKSKYEYKQNDKSTIVPTINEPMESTKKNDSFLKNQHKQHGKWIVVTTVNEPTDQIKFLSNIDQFQLLVVGDKKTNQSWNCKNATYLNIDEQEYQKYKSFKTTPFNSYTRKNIGYLYAIQNGAKFIYDTDDDNKPIVNLNGYFNFRDYDYGLIYDSSAPRVLNPYSHFGQPLIWPRGYPLSEIPKNHYNNYVCGRRRTSFVQQGVVNGDPDVDAIFRLTKTMNYKKIDINFDKSAPSIQYPIYKISPYNSQNTLFTYDAFWSLYLPYTVTFRLTDIWRSYWAQRLMWLLNGTVTFYGPNAYQSRNSHSYLNDYYQEKEMYLKTENLIAFLFDWKCNEIEFYACVIKLSEEMAKNDFWPYDEVDGIKNWIDDLNMIGYIQPKMLRVYQKSLSQYLNLNSSLIDHHFQVRYTPEFQKSIDFDNFCCKNQSNSLLELNEKIVSLQYLRKFCSLSNFTLKFDIDQIDSQSKHSDIVLLITFNIQIRSFTIEQIKNIYGNYFRNIVFCGKNINKFLNESQGQFKKFDSYTFIDVDTGNGYFHYYCMTKAIEMNFNTKGIFLMSDDVLLKYWELDKIDSSKVWFPERINCTIDLKKPDLWWSWWHTSMGISAYEKLINHFYSLNKSSEFMNSYNQGRILDSFLKNLRSNSITMVTNSSTIICGHMGSDLFYVPNSKFESFHLISSLYRYFDVFLELAVPGILSGLDVNFNMEIISGTYDWNRAEVFVSYSYAKIGLFFHPSKLINYNASAWGYKFCENFIQDKLSHF